MPKSFTVDVDFNDSRLDKWFKNKVINLPHSLIEKIIRQNKIKVNKRSIILSFILIDIKKMKCNYFKKK